MAEKRVEAMDCRIVGRLSSEPEAARTLNGVELCRMVVTKEAKGPASSPTQVSLYTKGELAKRCNGGLHEGDLIEAVGELRSRRQSSKVRPKYPEVLVPDAPTGVRLYGRAEAAA